MISTNEITGMSIKDVEALNPNSTDKLSQPSIAPFLINVNEQQRGHIAEIIDTALVKAGVDMNTLVAKLVIKKPKLVFEYEAMLYKLRNLGLMVAVHNDYRLNGIPHTFWLFIGPDDMSYKGEGKSDQEALEQVYEAYLKKNPT